LVVLSYRGEKQYEEEKTIFSQRTLIDLLRQSQGYLKLKMMYQSMVYSSFSASIQHQSALFL
jgi:hypothetical protein